MNRLTFILVLVVVASGCSSMETPDSGEGQYRIQENISFSGLASRAESTDYHVKYDYNGTGPLMYIGEPEVYSYDGTRKVSRPGNLPGEGMVNYTVYYRNDIEIDCAEGSGEYSGCSTLPIDVAPSTDHYSYRIERFNATKKGLETHLGRECNMYRLSGGDFINSYLDICLDSRKGFISFMEMYSPEYNRTVEEMEAVSYSPEASKNDVRPSVKAVPTIDCYEEKVNITTTDYSGEVKFQVNDGDNRTVEMSEWRVETFNISEGMEDGENTVRAYAGGSSDSSLCRM